MTNEFKPNWDLLAATQESLRLHMAEIQRLRWLTRRVVCHCDKCKTQKPTPELVGWMNPSNGVIIDARKKQTAGTGDGYPNFSIPCYAHIVPSEEPVIDRSLAIRVATTLGWEPKRKPMPEEMQKQMKERCDSMEMRGAFADGWLSAEQAHEIGEKQ